MALLEVHELQTYFSSREGLVRAVDRVSFEVDAGETLGIVGESGSGKSVAALTIMRLLPEPPARVAGGTVIFDGRDLLALRERELDQIRGREIAMIFQDPMTSLNPVMTVGDQIVEALMAHGSVSKGQARDRTVELLETVSLPSASTRIDDYPHQFSGGMRQRVMIAMALALGPRVIIADEPTTALDVTIQAQILELLRRLSSEFRTATILITHDLGIVAGSTDRVQVMYAGRIVERAHTETLFAAPMMPYTWGLLRSIPRLDLPRSARLTPIEGLPPQLTGDITGCRFEPRCPYRRDICRVEEPELVPVQTADPRHEARCWGTQDVPQGGWLIGADWQTERTDAATIRDIQGNAQSETPAYIPDDPLGL